MESSVTLWIVSEDLSHDMKAQIFSAEVSEDAFTEFKGKEKHAVGELKMLDLDSEKHVGLRFFESFGKARDFITSSLAERIQDYRDVKNAFHALRLHDVKTMKL